jgi:hypothetical protein
MNTRSRRRLRRDFVPIQRQVLRELRERLAGDPEARMLLIDLMAEADIDTGVVETNERGLAADLRIHRDKLRRGLMRLERAGLIERPDDPDDAWRRNPRKLIVVVDFDELRGYEPGLADAPEPGPADAPEPGPADAPEPSSDRAELPGPGPSSGPAHTPENAFPGPSPGPGHGPSDAPEHAVPPAASGSLDLQDHLDVRDHPDLQPVATRRGEEERKIEVGSGSPADDPWDLDLRSAR